MWLACLVLALAPAPATPGLDTPAAARLLQRSTAFVARSGRSQLEVRRIAPIHEPPAEPLGYFVEASWTVDRDGGPATEIGVATVVPFEQLDPDMRVLGMDAGWALADLAVGKTWDEVQAELAQARARAQEATALEQLRSILFAQLMFATEAGDDAYAGDWRCLTEPSRCIPGYAGDPMLKKAVTEAEGYRFTLTGKAKPDANPGIVSAFVATAVPLTPAPEKRALCRDAERFCVLAAAEPPGDGAAACPASCRPLE